MKSYIYSNRAFRLYDDNTITGYPLLDVVGGTGCYSCTPDEEQLDLEGVRELIDTLSAWLVEAEANRAAWEATLVLPEGER